MASLPCKTLQRNGVSIAYVSKPDVAFLYREIEETKCYFQHGITLPKGGTVIDVGANIGIFAAHAAKRVSSSGRVIACEPLPAMFAALQYNMKSTLNAGMHSSMPLDGPAVSETISNAISDKHYTLCCSLCAGDAPVTVLQCGVGDGTASEADFTLYPAAAGKT